MNNQQRCVSCHGLVNHKRHTHLNKEGKCLICEVQKTVKEPSITDPIIYPMRMQKLCDGTYKGVHKESHHTPYYGRISILQENDPNWSNNMTTFLILQEFCPICGMICTNIIKDRFIDDGRNHFTWFL